MLLTGALLVVAILVFEWVRNKLDPPTQPAVTLLEHQKEFIKWLREHHRTSLAGQDSVADLIVSGARVPPFENLTDEQEIELKRLMEYWWKNGRVKPKTTNHL